MAFSVDTNFSIFDDISATPYQFSGGVTIAHDGVSSPAFPWSTGKAIFGLGLFWSLVVCKAGLPIAAATPDSSATSVFHISGYAGITQKFLVQQPTAIGDLPKGVAEQIFNQSTFFTFF